MAAKSNSPKKKAPKASPPATPARKTKKPAKPPVASYFVTVSGLELTVSEARPNGKVSARGYEEFAEAREAAIDALVDAIEMAEDQLDAIKRAASFEEWRESR